MILLLAILYILVVITAIALTRARKYSNQWEETFKKESNEMQSRKHRKN